LVDVCVAGAQARAFDPLGSKPDARLLVEKGQPRPSAPSASFAGESARLDFTGRMFPEAWVLYCLVLYLAPYWLAGLSWITYLFHVTPPPPSSLLPPPSSLVPCTSPLVPCTSCSAGTYLCVVGTNTHASADGASASFHVVRLLDPRTFASFLLAFPPPGHAGNKREQHAERRGPRPEPGGLLARALHGRPVARSFGVVASLVAVCGGAALHPINPSTARALQPLPAMQRRSRRRWCPYRARREWRRMRPIQR